MTWLWIVAELVGQEKRQAEEQPAVQIVVESSEAEPQIRQGVAQMVTARPNRRAEAEVVVGPPFGIQRKPKIPTQQVIVKWQKGAG